VELYRVEWNWINSAGCCNYASGISSIGVKVDPPPPEVVVIPVEQYQLTGKLYPFISSFVDLPRIELKRWEVVPIRQAPDRFSLSFTEAPRAESIGPVETNLSQPFWIGIRPFG
jgi:hypothetical protein